MALGEFELIDRYFSRPPRQVRPGFLGIGDDCALFAPAPGMLLATSSDMLVEGRHFLSTVAPDRLGHKALAVNLSDLAACGATPIAFTLALALPRADEAFIAGFARGLLALADAHGCELIGGDTTQGPLNVCITVFGEVPAVSAGSASNGLGAALLRSGARPGDALYVSGAVGDARLALEVFRGSVALSGDDFDRVRRAMELPQPRVSLGIALRGIATSAIDVSDGLLGDLRHLLRRSGVGAIIEADAVPRSAVLGKQPLALQRECTLAGGDDYELLFTAPAARAAEVNAAARASGTAVTCIGRIVERAVAAAADTFATPPLHLTDADGADIIDDFASFDHFKRQAQGEGLPR